MTGFARALLAALMLAAAPAAAHAAPGELDTGFSKDGRVSIDFGGDEYVDDVAADGRGRVVLVGGANGGRRDFTIARVRADGRRDGSFSGDGRARVHFPAPSEAAAVATLPGGAMIVAGTTGAYDSDATPEYSYAIAVAKLRADGRIARGFGDGGRVVIDAGGKDGVSDVEIDARGRIVLAGYSGSALAVARLKSDGGRDRSFGERGVVTGRDLSPRIGGASGAEIDSEGRLVVVGTVGGEGPSGFDMSFSRLLADGSLDSGFASAGTQRVAVGAGRATDIGTDVALTSDGGIVGVGDTSPAGNSDRYDLAVAKLLSGGALDPAFSGDGRLSLDLGARADIADSVVPHGDGAIVSVSSDDLRRRTDVVKLVSIGADGELAAGFGRAGIATVGAADRDRDLFPGGLIRDGSRLLLGGAVWKPHNNEDFSLARLLLR